MSWVYVIRGEDGNISLEDAPNPHTRQESTLPLWAIKAGNIMYALTEANMRQGAWRAFKIVDSASKHGNGFARKIREGIRRIARSLQRQRIKGDDDRDSSPEQDIEAGGSIRA